MTVSPEEVDLMVKYYGGVKSVKIVSTKLWDEHKLRISESTVKKYLEKMGIVFESNRSEKLNYDEIARIRDVFVKEGNYTYDATGEIVGRSGTCVQKYCKDIPIQRSTGKALEDKF